MIPSSSTLSGLETQAISTFQSVDEGSREGANHRILYSIGRHTTDQPSIRPYDFKRPERISQDQLRSLKSLHERFARNYGGQLTGMSRMIVDMQIEAAEQISYAEYIASLGNPTCFATVLAPELGGRLLLEMSRQVYYPLIERLLGGDVTDPVVPDRALTSIETRLAKSVLHRAMQPLHDAWSGIRSVNFTIDSVESNPQIAQIISPNEVVLAIRFRAGLSGGGGTMSLCLPYALIENLIEDLGSRSWASTSGGTVPSAHTASVESHLSDAAVEISAILASTSITLSELQSMQAGDVILTGVPTTSPAKICVQGRPKFDGAQGQHLGRRAIQVISPSTKK